MAIKLNLGCGDQRLADFIGVDQLMAGATDVICNLEKGLPFADGTIGYIYAKSVVEHIEKFEELLGEMLRILKPHGELYIYVPHWSNPFFFSDYTHRRFFGLATFDYFAPQGRVRFRPVPQYSLLSVQTNSVRLIFHSPFRWLRPGLKMIQLAVNLSPQTQLFYEAHLSHVIPCYAIEYVLQGHS